jgi:hypothetical protein
MVAHPSTGLLFVGTVVHFVPGKKKENHMSRESAVTTNVPVVDESGWRQELDYLNRLLEGRPTEPEAKQQAKNELEKHDGVVNTIETEIAQVRALTASANSFLSPLDRKRLADRLEALEEQLREAHKLRERSIRKSGGAIKDCKEADKLRSRWLELKKRDRDIDAARSVGRGRPSELSIGMPKRWA